MPLISPDRMISLSREACWNTSIPSASMTRSLPPSPSAGLHSRIPMLRLSRLTSGRFLEACRLFLVPAREARRLLDTDKTFEQTRSGTGHTHALGQILPRIRALNDGLSCCSAVASPHFPRDPGQEREG